MLAIKSVTPTLPSLVNGKVPQALDRITMRLLEKKAAGRYASGTELARAFEDALSSADEAWDAPFDVPDLPSRHAKTDETRGQQKSPEVLPSLGGPTAAKTPAGKSPARSPSRFRAPTQEMREFVPPEEPGDVRPVQKPADPVFAARELLAQRLKAPSRLSRGKAATGIGLAVVVLAGLALVRSKAPAPAAKPESLLRKVERAEQATTATPASKPKDDETGSSGVPPLPPPVAAAHPAPATLRVPDSPRPATTQFVSPQRLEARHEVIPTARVSKTASRAPKPAVLEESSSLEFGQRVGADPSSSSASKGPVRYHVETGARIRASLDLNLDSRTVSSGPAAVRLRRAYISEGRVVFPAGTMIYGDARTSGTRFNVRFNRLVLPNKTEVPFEALAYDLQDRKPGLAPSRRIANAQQQDGTGTKVGRAVAGTMLGVVNGGLAQDAARTAGETALNSRDATEGATSGDALLLDAGAEMDVLVTKPF
jgi:hypothetical protein